jgi:hypothetical protein
MKGLQNSPAGKALNMVGADAFKQVLSQLTQNKKEDNNNNLLLQLIALLELINQVINTIDSVQPQNDATYKSNTSKITASTETLKNQSLYIEQCNLIVDLGSKINETAITKLASHANLIKTNSVKLREAVSAQIQSIKKV